MYDTLNLIVLRLCLFLFVIYNSQFWVLYIRHTIQYLCFQYVEHVRSIRIPIRTLYSMQSEYFVSEARARTAVSRPGSFHSKTNRTKVGNRPCISCRLTGQGQRGLLYSRLTTAYCNTKLWKADKLFKKTRYCSGKGMVKPPQNHLLTRRKLFQLKEKIVTRIEKLDFYVYK